MLVLFEFMVYNCRVFAWAVIMQVYFVMYCEINCLSSATHGHNIHSLVCVCVCLSVCLSVQHIFCQLAYRSDPSTDFYS